MISVAIEVRRNAFHITCFAIGFLGALADLAATPISSHAHKVTARYLVAQPNASAAAQITDVGAIHLADYGSFSLFAVPDAIMDAVTRVASALGLTLTTHDEYDTVFVPGGPITLHGALPLDRPNLGQQPTTGSDHVSTSCSSLVRCSPNG